MNINNSLNVWNIDTKETSALMASASKTIWSKPPGAVLRKLVAKEVFIAKDIKKLEPSVSTMSAKALRMPAANTRIGNLIICGLSIKPIWAPINS